jgi:hypothetical protein
VYEAAVAVRVAIESAGAVDVAPGMAALGVGGARGPRQDDSEDERETDALHG